MKPATLALALSLAFGSPSIAAREPTAQRIPVGVILKVVATDAGRMEVWRNGSGCDVWLGRKFEQRVSLAICQA